LISPVTGFDEQSRTSLAAISQRACRLDQIARATRVMTGGRFDEVIRAVATELIRCRSLAAAQIALHRRAHRIVLRRTLRQSLPLFTQLQTLR
jgi:hypothetical protein